MSYKKKKSEYYEYFVSFKNTPYLKEKTIIICMGYLFSGINLLAFGVFPSEKTLNVLQKISIPLGIVMLLMVPVSIIDKRRANRGTAAVMGTCLIHLLLCAVLSYVSSICWLIIYICEAVLCCGVIIVSITLTKK